MDISSLFHVRYGLFTGRIVSWYSLDSEVRSPGPEFSQLKSRLEVPETRDKTAMPARFRALVADLWPGHLAITGSSPQRDNRLH
ncbi:L-xylo-3-hexulose reductase [Fusarium oxysporum f. sp. albedinis]|nr:L-xylo-3-hexulose reductase [Fusarium oxysporum f. sp. albedinis]